MFFIFTLSPPFFVVSCKNHPIPSWSPVNILSAIVKKSLSEKVYKKYKCFFSAGNVVFPVSKDSC